MKHTIVTRYPFTFLFLLLCGIAVFPSCGKKDTAIPETAKRITSINLRQADSTNIDPQDVEVVIGTDSIEISVPGNISLSALIPVIVFTGANITPASGAIQDFTQPVKYTITAADSSKKEYVIKITRRDVLYIGASSRMLALDTRNGHLLWKDTLNGDFVYSNPLLHGDVLYAGSGNGYLYAFNARSGQVIWKQWFTDIGIEGPPTISGNTLYIGSNDDYFTALDVATGQKRWAFLTGGNVSSKSLIYGNKVIFGSSDGYVYALDTATSNVIWKYNTGGMIVASSPVLSNGVIFIGSRDNHLHAIDANTGRSKWLFDAGVSMEQAIPAVANGIVYAAGWFDILNSSSLSGSLYALDEQTGQKKWQALDTLGFSGPLCLDNGVIYISANGGYFYAVNAANGQTLWRKNIHPNGAGAAVKHQTVYVGGGGTWHVYALDASTGNEKWKFAIPDLDTSVPDIGRKKRRKGPFIVL